jgi:hypothetical protein
MVAPSVLIDRSYLTRTSMGTLKAAIDTLDTVSIIFGMVPLVGENLQSAAELASKICEQVQVRSDGVSRLRDVANHVETCLFRPSKRIAKATSSWAFRSPDCSRPSPVSFSRANGTRRWNVSCRRTSRVSWSAYLLYCLLCFDSHMWAVCLTRSMAPSRSVLL